MTIKNNYKILGIGYPMFYSILLVFLIRLVLSFLPSFDIDMGTWLGWAGRLSSLGLANFYSDTTWTQYTPGFMYWLWFIGKIGWMNNLAIKLPALLADISVGLLIYSLVKKVKPKLAIISLFLYALNPVMIFDGSVWGQIDGILTLFIFLSAYFLIEKGSLVWSIFFWSISFLIKPQAIAVLPVFVLVILLKKFKFKEIITAGAVGFFTIFALSLPFFPKNPILGLPSLITDMIGFYNFTSVNAFNIWSWVGLWKLDSTIFLGLPLSLWGTILLLSSITGALYVFRNKLGKKENYYLLFAICCLCFFVFPTRVHERYLFPFFAFLLTSAGLSKSLNLFVIYVVTSILCFLNLYYPYSYYNPQYLRSDFLYNLSQGLTKLIGFIFFVSYFVLLYWEKLPKLKLATFTNLFIGNWKKRKDIKVQVKLPKMALSDKKAKSILIMILVFAFVTKIYNLWSPKAEYFDEVYHAFTAKVMMGTEKDKAWEWWNTPPAGFAYEWTHPPLAKLGMVLGMSIFGQNSFGYRIPGALLGVATVFLIYLLAVEIFKDKLVGLLSAGVFSLDGLALVMGRIGMNDSYILFFTLLSIYFFLKKKDFSSALSFGFAIASKWSAIWAIPIFGILWLKRKKKFKLSLLWYLLLPITIYLLAYLPMFLTGHDLSVWWGMQQQMWWYHTGLRATHPYSSQWWSWPFLIRPIYLYTSSEIGGFVSRIYAMGSPVVFWFGLASVVASAIYSFVERNKQLGFVIFCYLMFFVPWATSPRIMFFYHYLPAIPFLAIATGYVLRRNPKLILGYLFIGLVVFIYFYPHWAGLQIPIWLDKSYYWIPSWR